MLQPRSFPSVASALLAMSIVTVMHADAPRYPHLQVELTSQGQHAYVRWANPDGPPSFGWFYQPTAGQAWSHDHEFDVYRAFFLYWIPRYHDVVTSYDIGLPESGLPETLRVNVTGGSFSWAGAALDPDWWAETAKQPLELRMVALDAEALASGEIDPDTAFNGLGQGTLIGRTEGNATVEPDEIRFNQAFVDLLNQREGGLMAFSLTFPFVDEVGYTELAYLPAGEEAVYHFKIEFDGDAAFPAVPEPSTYALAGAALCIAVAVTRRRRVPRGSIA